MPPGTTHILLVDDEEVDREVISRILEGEGYLVVKAGSYQEALAIFDRRSEQIDLLISDISLPHRNGVELAKALLKKNPKLKILLISGWVGAEILEVYGIPSADRHFLPKPFTAPQLMERVREILETDEVWDWLQPVPKEDRLGHSNGE